MTLQTFDQHINRAIRGEATYRCKNIERNTAKSRPSTPRDRGKRPKRPAIRRKTKNCKPLTWGFIKAQVTGSPAPHLFSLPTSHHRGAPTPSPLPPPPYKTPARRTKK